MKESTKSKKYREQKEKEARRVFYNVITHKDTRDIPDESETFTIEEWLDAAESGFIVDDDGIGYLALGSQMSTVTVCPSQAPFIRWDMISHYYDRVVWFNR